MNVEREGVKTKAVSLPELQDLNLTGSSKTIFHILEKIHGLASEDVITNGVIQIRKRLSIPTGYLANPIITKEMKIVLSFFPTDDGMTVHAMIADLSSVKQISTNVRRQLNAILKQNASTMLAHTHVFVIMDLQGMELRDATMNVSPRLLNGAILKQNVGTLLAHTTVFVKKDLKGTELTLAKNDSKSCVYWKPELHDNLWKSDGCKRVDSLDNDLICECDHLTAFATMDTWERVLLSKTEQKSLEIISTIGCSLSLVGVILTILAHAVLWKRLHKIADSKVPSKVLMNLCAAIGMTDIFAVLAGPARKNEVLNKHFPSH
ncbi:adhesion G-protein coupled receptor D1-like [Dendronephthya gigantea]|uniref:adhesion G-protein coupled receptor D1-like n=1 Tax=Dendronephthya gigantea TaxID=151771 RepID=UPI0010691A0D|nr:adhesion G-protein coupled receptor D1-like [Dendronephthya gigantea]